MYMRCILPTNNIPPIVQTHHKRRATTRLYGCIPTQYKKVAIYLRPFFYYLADSRLLYHHYLFGVVVAYLYKVGSQYRNIKFQYAVFVLFGGKQPAAHIKQHYIVAIGTFHHYPTMTRIYLGIDCCHIFYTRNIYCIVYIDSVVNILWKINSVCK